MSNISHLLEHNFDIKQRLVILTGDINDKTVANITKAFLTLCFKSRDPIHFMIQSLGGDLEGCFALYDMMKALPCQFYTYANGSCQSSAVLLLAAGTPGHRYSTEHCTFMMHDVTIDDVSGTLRDVKNLTKFYCDIDEVFLTLLSENSKLSIEEWRNIYNHIGDKYFTAKAALEYGIADAIIDNQFQTLCGSK